MKIAAILTAVLAGGALLAQDVPATDARIQLFVETMRPTKIQIAPGAFDQAGQLTGLGARFLGEVGSAPNWYYELGGMFDTSSNMTYNGTTLGGQQINLTYVQIKDSYWSLGAAYMAKLGALTFGLHLEGRGEYLRISGQATQSGMVSYQGLSSTYLRPWFRGSADYTFTGIGQDMHPFFGVDASFTPIRTGQIGNPDWTTSGSNQYSNFDQRNLNAMAPRVAAAVYAGLRF